MPWPRGPLPELGVRIADGPWPRGPVLFIFWPRYVIVVYPRASEADLNAQTKYNFVQFRGQKRASLLVEMCHTLLEEKRM